MKCPRCQREVNDENQFCPYCGQRLIKRREDPALKELNEIRKKMFSFIMNRIMNIATFVAVVFAIIGVFGPVLSYSSSSSTTNIGGLSWFVYEGWVMLNGGQLSVGPFITTFVLYIFLLLGVTVISSLAITRAITSLKRKEECKTIPHIILLLIIQRVYSSIVNCFYYEYFNNPNVHFETESAWGETAFNVGIPLFTIALIIYLIMRAVFTSKPKVIITHIFVVVSAFTLLSLIGNAFTTLAFQDIDLSEQIVFGTLHYFDVGGYVPWDAALVIIIMAILGLLLIAFLILYGISAIKNLVKHDEINRKELLGYAIVIASIVLAMVVTEICFTAVVNHMEGYENNIFHISGSLWGLILSSQFVLGLTIATCAIKEEEPQDPNIIDAEVVEKEEEN